MLFKCVKLLFSLTSFSVHFSLYSITPTYFTLLPVNYNEEANIYKW